MISEKVAFDPFDVLGLDPSAGEEEIRQRYLEKVKAHPPDRDPEGFKSIQEAYEKVKDTPSRLSTILFEPYFLDPETFVRSFSEGCQRNRVPLLDILRSARKP
jgi:curved DNA-binding protein CbpA